MKLYNTLSREVEEFKPLKTNQVTMYICGITPYDFSHLGHARTYCAFDILKRYLILKGYSVQHVQNITDIDDKIINRAKESKLEWSALSEAFANHGHQDFKALNILPAGTVPKVTEHIPEIIAMIKQIIDNGNAYVTDSGVYFDVASFEGYGKLSGQGLEGVKAGARVEIDEKKKNPMDFALWKAAKPGEPSWDSPWGKGRPGWHIECSAMSTKYIKLPIDIHGGGYDLIFPHHENEIAQSESALGEKFVNFWVHSGFLTIKGEKMAKSLKNFTTIRDLLKVHSANAVRLFFVKSHYRSQVDFTPDVIEECENSIKSIENSLQLARDELDKGTVAFGGVETTSKIYSEFLGAMDNDLNTPIAVSKMFEMISYLNLTLEKKKGNLLEAIELLDRMLWVFGIKFEKSSFSADTEKLVDLLVGIREELRAKKEFALTDRIRDSLKDLGIALDDSSSGTRAKAD